MKKEPMMKAVSHLLVVAMAAGYIWGIVYGEYWTRITRRMVKRTLHFYFQRMYWLQIWNMIVFPQTSLGKSVL